MSINEVLYITMQRVILVNLQPGFKRPNVDCAEMYYALFGYTSTKRVTSSQLRAGATRAIAVAAVVDNGAILESSQITEAKND